MYRVAWLVLLISCAASYLVSPGTNNKPILKPDLTDKTQQLTGRGKTLLDSVVDTGKLPDLLRPSFEDLRGEVKEFYASLNGSLAWISQSKPTARARAMIRLLRTADEKGLNSWPYDGPLWDSRIARLDQASGAAEADLIAFDVGLTVSSMRYASDLNIGRVNPRSLHFQMDVHDRGMDLSEFMKGVIVDGSDVVSEMRDLEPPFPAYRRTLAALQTYRELARQDDGEPLPVPGKTLHSGDLYAGVPRLSRLLRLMGDLSAHASAPSSRVYEGDLIEGVKHFQERHGLEPTGYLDQETLHALNTPLTRRVVQLELTLERWRWAPHKFVEPPIVVNIPEFRLHANDEHYHWVLSMKAVVGTAYLHQTPVFTSEIRSVILRPYWNVPLGIQRDEFIPKIEADPAYLAENSYDIVDGAGNVVDEDAVEDELKDKLRSGQLGLRQRPGPENALGLVKFDFPNQFDVYMHGTPSTELFSKSRRDFSHGCIRVEDPVSLASWVLRDQPEWTVDRIWSAMHGENTVKVSLSKPIPVLIVYGTAVVMEGGEVRFFEDIYGHDTALERALAEKERFQ